MSEYVRLKVGTSHAIANLDHKLNVQHTRNVVGSFYEALSSNLFHAIRWAGGEIYASESDRGVPPEQLEESSCLTPDLVRREGATWIESKGGNSGSQFKIDLAQALLYDRISRRATIPIYRPRVEYAIFMHELRRMTKRYKTPRALIHELAEQTSCAVLLDLSIVLKFEQWIGTVEYGVPGVTRGYYPPFFPISSKHLKLLIEGPRICLREMGLDACRYKVEVKEVGKGLRVNGSTMKPFTLLSIRRIRHPRDNYQGPTDRSWLSGVKQPELFEGNKRMDPLEQLADEDDFPF
jgi:hypothetical protein